MMVRRSQAKIHLILVVPEINAAFRSSVSAVMDAGKLEAFESEHEKIDRQNVKRRVEKFAREELQITPKI